MRIPDCRKIGPTLVCGVLLAQFAPPGLAGHEEGVATPPPGRTPSVELGPRMLEPGAAGVGERVAETPVIDIDGQAQTLFGTASGLGAVVVVRDPTCPVSMRYGPRIGKISRHYQALGYDFVFIYPSTDLRRGQRLEDRQSLGVEGVYVEHGSFALAAGLGVRSTGDVFVLDGHHRLRYRGAVDDQFGIGYTRDFPTRQYLRNALEAIKNGEAVPVSATSAPGCYIDADPRLERLPVPLRPDQMLS